MINNETESVKVLRSCIDLQKKKSRDYQNPASMIKQAEYYPNGVSTILDIIHAKKLRMDSVMAAMRDDSAYNPNFESLEDSAMDMINYCSFLVAYSRGKLSGQRGDRDFLNRMKKDSVPEKQVSGWAGFRGAKAWNAWLAATKCTSGH